MKIPKSLKMDCEAILFTLFISTVSVLIFTHVEVPFVFGILNDTASFSSKFLLSIPFITSIFRFDFYFLFPVFFITTCIFLVLIKKPNRQLVSCFFVAFFFSLLFVLRILNFDNMLIRCFFLLILSFIFLLSYYVFSALFTKNFTVGIFCSTFVISSFYFYTQKVSFSHRLFSINIPLSANFLLDILFLLSAICLILRSVSKLGAKACVAISSIFLFAFMLEWGILLGWSDAYYGATAKGSVTSKKNIILIVMDTFRRDYIDFSPMGLTPSIASLAKDSMVYSNAVSSSPWTLPAHASLFTGLSPSVHGAHFPNVPPKSFKGHKQNISFAYSRLAKENMTMAEIIRKFGYTSYGVVSNYGYLNHSTGIAQGFDYYDDRQNAALRYLPLPKLIPAFFFPITEALAKSSGFYECDLQYRLKSNRLGEDINRGVNRVFTKERSHPSKRPFFLFVNYMDTHVPRIPQPVFREKHRAEVKNTWLSKTHIPGWEAVMKNSRKITSEEKSHITTTYEGEVNYLDTQLGELFKLFKRLGIYDNSMIILTSDHGEFLGEHNLIGHACGLYSEVIDIPLLVKLPHNAMKGEYESRVALNDVLPMVLAFVENKPRPILHNDDNIVSELYPNPPLVNRFGERFSGLSRSLIKGDYKLISRSVKRMTQNHNNRTEYKLFNLSDDPEESVNLIKTDKNTAEKMKKTLDVWERQAKPIAVGKGPLSPGKEEIRRLKSLGYL